MAKAVLTSLKPVPKRHFSANLNADTIVSNLEEDHIILWLSHFSEEPSFTCLDHHKKNAAELLQCQPLVTKTSCNSCRCDFGRSVVQMQNFRSSVEGCFFFAFERVGGRWLGFVARTWGQGAVITPGVLNFFAVSSEAFLSETFF